MKDNYRKINSSIQGYLDDKKVRIWTFDIIDKIKKGNIDSNYEFRFTSDRDTAKDIIAKTQDNVKIDFKVYDKEGKLINVNLQMRFKFAGDFGVHNECVNCIYEIINVQNK